MATQNPIEQEGTYPLPEAALDRFMFSLWMDYPRRDEEERAVAETPRILSQRVERAFTRQELLRSIDLVWRMPVGQHVVGYAVALARANRPAEPEAAVLARKYVQWGAGPRAGQYLVLGAKALTALEGSAAPTCQHVRRVAAAVLRHRLVLNYAASGDGVTAQQVIERVLAHVAEPRH